ncbi:MAG: hypothetical protein MUO76_21095, partial [Anaerolineaceae bacterium]|nr:hypothetical protein [Anaerolineaceae bacterium]
ALHVREGKGAKERLVPYGELDWCLVVVDKWLEAAGISSGPVFRGLYKGGKKLRPGRQSLRAIEYITTAYPIARNGEMVIVRPHDLRRTYARRLYEAGADTMATSCPLCQMNLEMHQTGAGPKMPMFYFTELIGLAFGLEEAQSWLKQHLVDPLKLLNSLEGERV